MFKNIVIIPTEGFANRLRAIASTSCLSNFLNIPFFVIWEKEKCCNIEIHQIFNTPFDTIDLNHILNSKYYFSPNLHTNNYLSSLTRSDTEYDFLIIKGGHEFKHDDMDEQIFLYKKHQFYHSLQFTSFIQDYIQQFSLPNNVIGIHFRDFVRDYDHADARIFSSDSPLSLFNSILKNMLTKNPNQLFYLSTNTSDAKQFFINNVPSKNIIHYDHNNFQRNDHNGILNAVIDFVLLSKTKYILGSYMSSFSDEAAFFNFIPKCCIRNHNHNDHSIKYHCYGSSVHHDNVYLLYKKNLHNDIFVT